MRIESENAKQAYLNVDNSFEFCCKNKTTENQFNNNNFLEFYMMQISNFKNMSNKNAHEMYEIFKNTEIANVLIHHFNIRILRQTCIVGTLYITLSDF